MPKSNQRIIGLDTETTGVDFYHGARPFLVTIAYKDGTNKFWEWDVDPFTRKVKAVKEDLREIREEIVLADVIALQNGRFDCRMLRGIFEDNKVDFYWDWSKCVDTLIAGHLLKSNQPHDLTTMAIVYLGINVQPFEDELKQHCNEARRLVRKKYPRWRIAEKGLEEMPSAKESTWKYDQWLLRTLAQKEKLPEDHPYWTTCSEYANSDSVTTVMLWLEQKGRLKFNNLYRLFEERMKLLPIIIEMEDYGVSVSGERLEQQIRLYQKESKKLGSNCLKIAKSYGVTLTLPKSGNNNALKEFLFGTLRIKTNKKSKKTGAMSLDKEVLEELEDSLRGKPLEFIQSLRQKRSRDTAINYMEGYKKFWLPHGNQSDWHILHPSLNPTGTDTLRWSSSNPNEQNISKKDGFNLRYCFGPAPGREWWALDYENIELRIPGYESGEEKMIELFEKSNDPPFFGSYHLLNASIVFPEKFWPLAEKKGAFKEKYKATYYQWIKNGGFAKQYGAQAAKVNATFHREGGYEKISECMPKMEALNQYYIGLANKQGYVETLPDRSIGCKRGYPIYCSRSQWGNVKPTIPLNYHIQSTAMYCTMKAMIRCYDRILQLQKEKFDARIVLQVHDEMVFDLPKGGKKNLFIVNQFKMLMEQSGEDIGIPLKCSVSYHPENWAEAVAL